MEANKTAAPPVNPWVIALTVMLATFMEVLDTSVANVSLPHIAGSLGATVDEATWVLTSYLVANAIVLPLSGWFSLVIGRKRFYMACVALFTVSSTLCGLAPNLNALILFRIMQGLGGGALQPVAQAILVENFPQEKRGMAMAVYGMGVVLAPVIGPTLGGWITDNYDWRWIFLINIPVGILSLAMTSALIFDPDYLTEQRKTRTPRMDYVGLGLLAVGLGFLEIVLDEGQRQDWFSSNLIAGSLLVAAIALVSVVVWELRHPDPVVDFRLLKERNFLISTLTMFVLGFVLYGSTMLLPLYLQTLMGYTATLSGLILSPGGAAILVMMPIVATLMKHVAPRWIVIFGLACSSAGLWMMSNFNLQVDFHYVVLSRIVQSLGLAFLFVPINAMAFEFVPKPKTNYATGLINLARNIGGSSGIALATTLLARRSQFHQHMLAEHVTELNASARAMLEAITQRLVEQGASLADATRQAQAILYGTVVKQASMLSFVDVFWIFALLFLAVAPLMLLMKKSGPHAGPMHFD